MSKLSYLLIALLGITFVTLGGVTNYLSTTIRIYQVQNKDLQNNLFAANRLLTNTQIQVDEYDCTVRQLIDNETLQTTALNLSQLLTKSETKITEYQSYVRQLKETNSRQEKVLLEAAGTIKDLTDDNVKLQSSLDNLQSRVEAKEKIVEYTEKELADVRQKLRIALDNIVWYRNQYEKKTGEVMPMPPNSLK